MKPRIGIVSRPLPEDKNGRQYITESTRKAILAFGGNPFLILPVQDCRYGHMRASEVPKMTEDEKAMIEDTLSLCDGIVMPGGFRIYEHDFFILDYAIKNDVPILGTCVGMQIMASYGKDIDNRRIESEIDHQTPDLDYSHEVVIDSGSRLFEILGTSVTKVDSRHSYTPFSSGIYNIVAKSPDGIIEAIELPGPSFNIGTQWHPEVLYPYHEPSRRFLTEFIKCSSEYMKRDDKTNNSIKSRGR